MDRGGRARERALARALGLAGAVSAAALVAGAVLLLQRIDLRREEAPAAEATSFRAAAPPPPPPSRPPREARPKRSPPRAPPPAALLDASLAGLDLGLPAFQPRDAAGSADELLGAQRAAVMTEETVDRPPRPVRQLAPEYPRTARARNVQGSVRLAVLVDEAGRVADAQVLQSEPPGVFDAAALAAVRTWQFEPALYQGQPVRMRMHLHMPFRLE